MSSLYTRFEVNDRFFEEIGKQQAWLLGLLAADGYISKDGKRLGISQSHEYGRDVIEHIKSLLNFEGNISSSQTKINGKEYGIAHSVKFTSAPMIKALSRYGITSDKTKNFKYPTELPKEMHYSFLRGYIDGDGCCNFYTCGYGSQKMLKISAVGTPNLVATLLEMHPTARRCQKNGTSIEEIVWNGKHAVDFGCQLYEDRDLYLSPKAARFYEYLSLLEESPTKWYSERKRKSIVIDLSRSGKSAVEIINETGENFKSVYRWLKMENLSREGRA